MSGSGYAMKNTRSKAGAIVLVGLLLLTLLNNANGVPHKRSLIRLCSTSLSDALHLACKDNGYNEPFSYSGEISESQESMGPGLAEECCYHQCTFEQLRQYCKESENTSPGAVSNQVRIEKYPYPSTRSAASSSSEERSRSNIEYVHSRIKCRNYGSKGARKKGANLNRDDDAGGCDGRNSLKKHRGGHCGCRHRRQRRRRLGKMLVKTLINKLSGPEASSPVSPNGNP